ncbi:MAG: XRE family transcriptional regulator [Desulfurellales bacterium]|nr:MAG: XRE family transcriptional regulator [Desulfurellales bacterium]
MSDDHSSQSYLPTMMELMKLRQVLRMELERRGWSLAELSRRSRVPKATVADWAAGRQPRDVAALKRVADVLGLTVDELCFGRTTPAAEPLQEALGNGWLTGLFEVRIRRVK